MWILLVAREEAPHQLCHLLIGQDIPKSIGCHDEHILLLQLQLVHIQHSHLQVKTEALSDPISLIALMGREAEWARTLLPVG